MTAASTRLGIPAPMLWLGISVLLVGTDFGVGPFVQFPITFVIPVGLAAWFSGLPWALLLAFLLPLFRIYFRNVWEVPWAFEYSLANAALRIAILATVALFVAMVARKRRDLTERVKTLEGLLPICSGCKKIRDEADRWQPLEDYIGSRSSATFTHGICPRCSDVYFGDFAGETGDEP